MFFERPVGDEDSESSHSGVLVKKMKRKKKHKTEKREKEKKTRRKEEEALTKKEDQEEYAIKFGQVKH